MKRLVDQDKGSLTGEAKAAHASKENVAFIHFFPLPGNQGLSAWLRGKTNDETMNVPPFSFPGAVAAGHIIRWYGVGYPFGQFRSAVLGMCPPSFLPSLSLLAGGRQSEEKVKALLRHSQNTGLLSTLF